MRHADCEAYVICPSVCGAEETLMTPLVSVGAISASEGTNTGVCCAVRPPAACETRCDMSSRRLASIASASAFSVLFKT